MALADLNRALQGALTEQANAVRDLLAAVANKVEGPELEGHETTLSNAATEVSKAAADLDELSKSEDDGNRTEFPAPAEDASSNDESTTTSEDESPASTSTASKGRRR